MIKSLPQENVYNWYHWTFPNLMNREISIICRKMERNTQENGYAPAPVNVLELISILSRSHFVLASRWHEGLAKEYLGCKQGVPSASELVVSTIRRESLKSTISCGGSWHWTRDLLPHHCCLNAKISLFPIFLAMPRGLRDVPRPGIERATAVRVPNPNH